VGAGPPGRGHHAPGLPAPRAPSNPPLQRYFAVTTGAALVLLAAHVLAPTGLALSAPGVKPLLIAVALSAVNALAIEPYVTGLMFDRYDIENKPVKTVEDEGEIKRLYKKFGM
jgi:hypothetical protein